MDIVARFESGQLCAVMIGEGGRTRLRVACPDGSTWEQSYDGAPPVAVADQIDMAAALHGPSLSGHAIHPDGSDSDRECSYSRCSG